MPRRNPPREIYAEKNLALRIGLERARRGWSYDGLASRMTAVGCPLQPSALHKIERADPPRRITVDEMIAYSRVFGVPVEELLADPDLAAEQRLRSLLDALRTAEVARDQAEADHELRVESAWDAVADLAGSSTAARAVLDRHLGRVEDRDVPDSTAALVAHFTGDGA